ncbi:MAG: DUF432 domain-containing protein [Thermodesulfobacteriota bacterium]
MFGQYTFPLTIDLAGVFLAFEKAEDNFIYRRQCQEGSVTKALLNCCSTVLIHPIEPLNTPKSLTPNLLIDFENSVVLEPRAEQTIFLKFPVEIGVFISSTQGQQLVDVFSLQKQKFTVYGEPSDGVLCKHWKSAVYTDIPDTNPCLEGVLELNITSANTTWLEITKVVVSAYGMKIFFDNQMVALKGSLKIKNGIAETDFEDAPLKTGMIRATKNFTARLLSTTAAKFVMEHGI